MHVSGMQSGMQFAEPALLACSNLTMLLHHQEHEKAPRKAFQHVHANSMQSGKRRPGLLLSHHQNLLAAFLRAWIAGATRFYSHLAYGWQAGNE